MVVFFKVRKRIFNKRIWHFWLRNFKRMKDCPNCQLVLSLDNARQNIEAWRQEYNMFRLHSSLAGYPPNELYQIVEKNNRNL
jgi:transposase InsO family protein